MQSMLEKAINIASSAHFGQIDKGGAPYILHPLRVMFAVKTLEEKIVAVLHDIVEDTSISLNYLAEKGFSNEIISAIDVLTKRSGETRSEAAHRAKSNSIARIVKIADVKDNLDLSRISNPSEKDYFRQKEYYAVLDILLG